MALYKIAGLTVEMEPKYEPLLSQAKKYLYDGDDKPQISISLSDGFLEEKMKIHTNLNKGLCEYVFMGSAFYNRLLEFDGFLLHSSAIEYEGNAYLFSASSGTGKSTHTNLWKERFGEENVRIINDDKPALIFRDGKFFVCGTPFSGKTDLSLNVCVPLKGICFLYRSEKNQIKKSDSKSAISNFMNQTFRPANPEKMDTLLTLLDKLLKAVPVFSFGCNISLEAAELSYKTMKEA